MKITKRLPFWKLRRDLVKLLRENNRIVLTRYGFAVAALVSLDDLNKLEDKENG